MRWSPLAAWVREDKAEGVLVFLGAGLLEAHLLEDCNAGVVPYLDERPERCLRCVLPMPFHECSGDLRRQALTPMLAVNRVAEATPGVVAAADPRPAHQSPVVVCEPPLRPASLAMLHHVLINKLLGFAQRFRPSVPHEAHGLRVGVHVEQRGNVAWQPGSEHKANRLEDDVAMLTRCRAGLVHDRRVSPVTVG